MPTLAQSLLTTTPVSSLLRKARRLGLHDVTDFIELAVERGCSHYRFSATTSAPPRDVPLPNDELTILLLVGENRYEPNAIRCAAQLARSPDIDPIRLARLAIREKCERVLAHISRAGSSHDAEGSHFWTTVLRNLPHQTERPEVNLPHWSRFVSMPGVQRNGPAPITWLVPRQ